MHRKLFYMGTGLSDEIWIARTGVRKYYGVIPGYLLLGFSFFIPLWPKVLPLLLIGSAASLLFSYRPFHRVRKKELFIRPVLLFTILLFAAYVLGMLWSTDYAYGRTDLVIKLPMLVLPVLFFMVPIRLHGRRLLTLAFIMGCVYSILLCLALASYRSLFEEGHWIEEFSYSRFSILLHPSYFSMYLVVAFAAWFLFGFFAKIKGFMRIGIPCILLLGILLAGSKAGWAVFAVLLFYLLIHYRKNKGVRKVLGAFVMSMVIGAVLTYALVPTMQYRMNEFLRFLKMEEAMEDPSMKESSAVRVAIWNAAGAVVKEHWIIGTGTGDVKNELLKEYEQRGMHNAVKKRLNGHSQLMQTTVTLGVMGLSILLGLFGVPAYLAVRRKDWMMMVFLGIIFLNWLVESMLEVQAGVIFFAWGLFVFSMRD